MVCEALRARKEVEKRSWEVVEGDAYDLPQHVGPNGVDTIVYCSVLHEIYSYVRWPMDAADGATFRLDSVRELIRSSWKALSPGGRIVIRDGIKPAPAIRRIRFKDPHGPEFLELFAEQFEGRPITHDWVDAHTAELSAPDAMEFLYCYTWGPASFPYEVREQYGVMQYDAYVEAIISWVFDLGGTARVVDIPVAERSYLQPGYIEGLAPRIDLLDEANNPVPLPDSNCLIVVEKGPG
jgi:SAM-dependent methyltransferase